MNTDDLVKILTTPREKEEKEIPAEDLLSTGSTLLNLALSGKVNGGFPAGKYIYFVGDSSSGKTFFCLTCMAEAQVNEKFKDYRLIYDNAEDGALMDISKFFGTKVAKKIEAPAGTAEDPKFSTLIEEFYSNIDNAIARAIRYKKPFIYVLDSMDALGSKYGEKKFQEKKEALAKGTEAKGDYGDGKAKFNSENLRRVCSGLSKTGSILIIISQTRDNIDAGLYGPAQTRAGGRALKFYAAAEVWTSANHIKKEINGKDRSVGINVKAGIKKNRISGKAWTVSIPLYWSYGIDDIGGCVDFLIEEGAFPKGYKLNDDKEKTLVKGRFDVTEIFGDKDKKFTQMSRDDIVKHVDLMDLEDEIKTKVAEVWKTIEDACTLKRKKRYE